LNKINNKAKAYSNKKRYIAIAELVIYLVFFLTIGLSGISDYLADTITELLHNYYLCIIIYIAIIGISLNAATFLLDYESSYRTEHLFGLSRQNLKSWFGDYCKKSILYSIIYAIIIVVLYLLMRISPTRWWIYVSIIYFLLGVVLAKIFPVVIIPLFYKLEKVPSTPLRERLLTLAEKAGIQVMDIYNIGLGKKTKKANAALCGVGKTRRILLSDTLIQGYSEDEIESTLAHELAHHKYKHFWKLTFWNFASTLSCFIIIHHLMEMAVDVGYIRHISHIGGFWLLVLIFLAYNTAITPLLNFISRRYELEADTEATSLTNRPDIFAQLMEKLCRQNLSDPNPHPLVKYFFYDHPPAAERIKRCEELISKKNGK